MKRFTVLAFAVLVAATPGVFAASEAETATADDGPVVINWVGLRLKTPGGALYPQPDSPIIQEFNKALNIDLRVVKSDAFSAEEMNLLFAAGEIPDHMLANQTNMLRYQDEGLLRAVPLDMVKEHAPTYWRDYANGEADGVWFDFPSWNKDTETLWAVPNGGSEIKHQVVVRGDWLEALGASVPTTVEEFAEVARQFTYDDPDGNGQKDTWGMATSATSAGNWTNNLRTFVAAFGFEHIERPYLDPATGEITFFEVTDGWRDFLRWMNGMWEAGVIHPDVTLPDKLAVGSLFQDGKVGFAGDTWTYVLPKYRPGTWFPNLFEKDPGATVEYVGQLTAAGYEPTWELRAPLWTYHVIGKDTSDLALEKILGVIDLQLADPFFHNLIWSGIEGEHFEFDEDGMRQFLPAAQSMEAQGDLGVKYFLTNIRYGWMFTASFGSDALAMAERQKGYNIINPALGHGWVLETQNEYRADMSRIREEYMWKAITGDANTDGDWDTYVKQWMRAGGEEVLAEARAKHADM
ncbi:MAG: extracellular solute-binding protein [Spirochaetaceae bacterium]|nr:extracellular solute-binding protein [Spirochaetaceae bacterium]